MSLIVLPLRKPYNKKGKMKKKKKKRKKYSSLSFWVLTTPSVCPLVHFVVHEAFALKHPRPHYSQALICIMGTDVRRTEAFKAL